MKRLLPLFLPLFLFTTCAGFPFFSQMPPPLLQFDGEPFFSSMPLDGSLVFIGASGKRSDPKETVKLALEDAALRVAMFYQVYGEYALENFTGSGAFDFTYNTHTVLRTDVEGSKQYVEVLQFNADTDTFEYENTFFIRATYPVSLPSPVNYRPAYRGADRKPDWIENPPHEIDGYEAVVSFSARYSSMAVAYNNSRNNAVFAIIRNNNTVSQANNLLYQETSSIFGYKTANNDVTYSYGTLYGFYVLDSWINPADKTVWTLAIAKKSI